MATIAGDRPLARGAESTLSTIIKGAREAPLLAVVILGGLILVAVFADLIAPYDPTFPGKGARIFDPPFWMEGGNTSTPLSTDLQGLGILSRLGYATLD